MISENIAREYWREPADALGHRIQVSTKDDWREIVVSWGTFTMMA